MTIARLAIVAALSALAVAVSPASADTTVSISLDEFSITASPGSAPAGPVNFQVTNFGQTFHSFLVAATDLPADQLPVDKQTNTVIEGQLNVVANTGDIQVGQSTSVSPALAPGNYVLFCNIPGHYTAGQRLAFQVTAAVAPTATTAPEETPSTTTPAATAPTAAAPAVALPSTGVAAQAPSPTPWLPMIALGAVGAVLVALGLVHRRQAA